MDKSTANLFILPMGFGSAILLALSAYTKDGTFAFFSDNESFQNEISIIVLISYLYFLTDFIMMIAKYEKKYQVYFLHHFVGMMAIVLTYFWCKQLIKYLLAYLTFEISTPFLNLAMFLRDWKINTLFSKTINIIFFLSFTIVRILFGTYLLYAFVFEVYQLGYPFNRLIFLPISLQLLNYWWFYRIIRMLKRAI